MCSGICKLFLSVSPDDLRPDVDGGEVAGDDLSEEEGGDGGDEREADGDDEDAGEGAQAPAHLVVAWPPVEPQDEEAVA